jgi:hypothetical protein
MANYSFVMLSFDTVNPQAQNRIVRALSELPSQTEQLIRS